MKFVPNAISRAVTRKALQVQKNSPHILFAGGVVGVVGATVLACKATLRLENELDNMRANLDAVAMMRKNHAENYTEKEAQKTTAHIYTVHCGAIAKLYAPAAALGLVSLAALTGSHVQLNRRNQALTATVVGLQTAYSEYRNRVREEVGDEKEQEIYFGTETEEVTDDKGKKRKIKSIGDPSKFSPYAKIFDESNVNYVKDAEINRMFVEAQQRYANDLLRARGHIFLNEVYDMLGFDHTGAGATCGWVISSDGDNFVDFQMFNPDNARFINGHERSIIIDPNVDGVIWDKI